MRKCLQSVSISVNNLLSSTSLLTTYLLTDDLYWGTVVEFGARLWLISCRVGVKVKVPDGEMNWVPVATSATG